VAAIVTAAGVAAIMARGAAITAAVERITAVVEGITEAVEGITAEDCAQEVSSQGTRPESIVPSTNLLDGR
jgi:hypothetical protein